MSRIRWGIAILCLVVPALALAQATGDGATQAQGMQVMQDVLDSFGSSLSNWIAVTQTAGLRLFGILAAIEMFFKGKDIIKRGDDLFGAVVVMLMQSFLTWGFFLWLINNPITVLGMIPKSFQVLGGQASGLGTLNPSQMVGSGINIAVALASSVSTLTAVANPIIGLITSATLILIVCAFALLGFQMFAALMHYYILCAASPVLLAGGALSHTRDWAIKQIQGSVATGINIFVIYLIAGVVTAVVPAWKAALANGGITQVTPLLVMLVGALLILFMAFKAPSIANGLMNGTSSMSANEMLGFGMGAMTVALGGAIAAAKGFTGAVGAMGNALGGLGNAAGGLGGLGGFGHGTIRMADAFPSSSGSSGGGPSGAGGGGSSGGGSGGGSSNRGGQAASRQDTDGLLGPMSGEYADVPMEADGESGGIGGTTGGSSGSSVTSGDAGSSGVSGGTGSSGSATPSSSPAPTGDASDASIGGSMPSTSSSSSPMQASEGQAGGNKPKQKGRLERFHERLDQVNQKVQGANDQLQRAMPDSTHQGTLHIDHKQ